MPLRARWALLRVSQAKPSPKWDATGLPGASNGASIRDAVEVISGRAGEKVESVIGRERAFGVLTAKLESNDPGSAPAKCVEGGVRSRW